MAVTFTKEGAEKLRRVVHRVLTTPTARGNQRTHSRAPEPSFWAYLSGGDMSGTRYSIVRVIPVADETVSDLSIGPTTSPLFYQIAEEQPENAWAREASGLAGVPTETVVKVEFCGYDSDGNPAYLFSYGAVVTKVDPWIHDHRDNFNGGFAFSVYHPGTSLPQVPFNV